MKKSKKVKIFSENVDWKSQNQVLVNILARQKSKVKLGFASVQNDVNIADTLAKRNSWLGST